MKFRKGLKKGSFFHEKGIERGRSAPAVRRPVGPYRVQGRRSHPCFNRSPCRRPKRGSYRRAGFPCPVVPLPCPEKGFPPPGRPFPPDKLFFRHKKFAFSPLSAFTRGRRAFFIQPLCIFSNPPPGFLVKIAQKEGANFHILRRGLRLSFLENDGMIDMHGELGGALSRPLCNI